MSDFGVPIEWDDNLKSGVPVIDEQHRGLILMLNRLGRLRCGKESLLEALVELEDYVDVHFKTEADYMLQTKYPKLKEHKACHEKFASDLKTFQDKLSQSQDYNSISVELYDFICDWIVNHYSNLDVELVQYIKKSI